MYAHAWHKSMCLWFCVWGGIVPEQELQVHCARTQAAVTCTGHVYAQLCVLAAGRRMPSAPPAPAECAALFLHCGWLLGLSALRPGHLSPALVGQAGGSAPSRVGRA